VKLRWLRTKSGICAMYNPLSLVPTHGIHQLAHKPPVLAGYLIQYQLPSERALV
jgi:hypothetical protein